MSDTPKLWTDDEIKELWQRQELERERDEARAECERLNKWIDAMNSSAAIDAERGQHE
jgi:hypothetical protein